MSTRKTLDDRVENRNDKPDRRSIKDRVRYRFTSPQFHIRAEYNLLARRVRKLNILSYAMTDFVRRDEVLALIRELKK